MKTSVREIYYTTSEFIRTFGAFQLFFLRLVKHSPHILITRLDLVVKQVFNSGALSLSLIHI